MKFRSLLILVFTALIVGSAIAADTDIKLNSLGFLPKSSKKATISNQCKTFVVKKTSNNKQVFSGQVTGPLHQDDVDQDVWIADFSQVTKKGKYYIEIPDVGRSFDFEIGEKVYNFAYYTAMRGMYLWRCGTAVSGEHNGVRFEHEICHTNDGWEDYMGNKDSQRDGVGGWHDAGDHGKYVVNAGITVASMFYAWEHFQKGIKKISLDIPDTAPGYPDFLKEMKWETDWLLKMQYPDGSGKVSHKLTRLNFSGFIMPEDDDEKRYFTEWSSAATADFVAMMAMAARNFKPYDAAYAKTCLEAAKKSYQFLKENPEQKMFTQREFRTGGYGTGDGDDRMWAAAEMWETTGDKEYLADFEKRAAEYKPVVSRWEPSLLAEGNIDLDWDWGNVRNLGQFTYILSNKPGKNPELVKTIKTDIFAAADSIVKTANKDVYARPLGGKYYWGCNGTVARQVINLMVANKLEPNKAYVNTSLDAIGHLFGRNYYGRSFVTGLGHNPAMNPHDRRSGADNNIDPWPGYVVGGGHSAVGWKDEQEDYATNEIAINWQGALIYALAAFASGK